MRITRLWLMLAVVILVFLSFIILFSTLQPGRARASDLEVADYALDHFVVKLRQESVMGLTVENTGSASLDRLMRQYGVESAVLLFDASEGNLALKKKIGLSRTFVLTVKEGMSVTDAVAAFRLDPQVEYAELDYLTHASITPNDSYYASDQWALNNTGQLSGTPDADIDAPEAWNVTTGSSEVIIAVIDTGLDFTHPEFPQEKIAAGYNFVNPVAIPQDDNWHGTHVSGIAAAATNNSNGIAGVCWACKIMPLKALGSDGVGWSTDMADAIEYAVDHSADVINMSVVVGSDVNYLHESVIYAYESQVPIAAAMGNNGDTDNSVYYPAAYSETIAVGATNNNDLRADFSCYGSHIDLVAPGVTILSTIYDDFYEYAYAGGTSMATPHVAGVLGLIESLKPDFTVEELREILRSTSDDLGTPGWDMYYGSGRLNAYQAMSPFFDPESIKLTASTYGLLNTPYKATALVSPTSAVLPLTFLWEADGQGSVTHTVDLEDSINYTWSITGTYWITVNVSNDFGAVSTSKAITIIEPYLDGEYIFLPLVLRP